MPQPIQVLPAFGEARSYRGQKGLGTQRDKAATEQRKQTERLKTGKWDATSCSCLQSSCPYAFPLPRSNTFPRSPETVQTGDLNPSCAHRASRHVSRLRIYGLRDGAGPLFARRRFRATFQGPELKHSRPSPRGIAAGERTPDFEQ